MSLPDLTLNTALLAQAFVTVLVIMDPLGNVPIFLALTRRAPQAVQRRAALQSVGVATGVILMFALFGQTLLSLLGISLQALQVAGGLLLGIIALELLHPRQDTDDGDIDHTNIAFVPLGTPLLAGPGAIAATMLSMERAEGAGGVLSVILALLGALTVVYLALRFSGAISRVLKDNGINLVTRVMGLLAAAIAVQLVAGAVADWVRLGVA